MATLGIDCDGCLADFNSAFIPLVVKVTGKDLFPPRPFDIPCWDYPNHYGYSQEDVINTFDAIHESSRFWAGLPEYPTTRDDLFYLQALEIGGNDIYFITNRPGIFAKQQTEAWLQSKGFYHPTVLISGKKGAAAYTLSLDYYIDDNDTYIMDVLAQHSTTKIFLMNRPWNVTANVGLHGIERVDRISGIAGPLEALV